MNIAAIFDHSLADSKQNINSDSLTNEEFQPEIEKQAISLFNEIGRLAVEERQLEISNLAKERMNHWVNEVLHGFDDSNYTAIDYLNPPERAEFHLLNLALTLCVDQQAEAAARVRARIAERRAKLNRAI